MDTRDRDHELHSELAGLVRATELEHLYSYGKAEGGATTIPITQAMDELAKQGLPTRPQTSQTAQAQATPVPSAANSNAEAEPKK